MWSLSQGKNGTDIILKKHDKFIKFILEELNEENGIEIGSLFNYKSSRQIKRTIKQPTTRIATKLFESYKEPIIFFKDEAKVNKQTEYFYLFNKEKDEKQNTMASLFNYLKENEEKQKKFYYGSVIKQLQIKEFLQWSVNINKNKG